MRGRGRLVGALARPAARRAISMALAGALGFTFGPRIEGTVLPALRQVARAVPLLAPPGLSPLPETTAASWRDGWRWLLDRAIRATIPAGATASRTWPWQRARAEGPAPRALPPLPAASDAALPATASPRLTRADSGAGEPGPLAAAPGTGRVRPGLPAGPAWERIPRAARYLVAIYHTHTSEEYAGPESRDVDGGPYHRFGTSETGIVRVGRALAEALRRLGIPTLHIQAVHDYPDYRTAYARSRETVRSLVERYPELQLIIDLHRDAPQEGGYLVTQVDGREVARIALVVGAGGRREAPLPNRLMAEELTRVADSRFPGLMRRILEVAGRTYNQDLHPGSLLVEIGSYRTDEQAAVRAARLLAVVIAEALRRRASLPERL